MSRRGQGANWCLLATAALLLLVATTSSATAKAGPAAGAAGSGSPLLAAVDASLEVDQVLDVGTDVAGLAGVELALEAPRSWTYLDDLARFSEDAKWRLEVDVQGLAGGCLEPFLRLKTRVRGYQLFRGGNKAVKNSLSPYAARDCDPSRTAGPVRGVFTTTDPLGYVDGPNLYQFALSNPVNNSDPMGLFTVGGLKSTEGVMRVKRLGELRQQLANVRAEIAKRQQLNTIRTYLVNEVAHEEWAYTLGQLTNEAGLNLQDRAAVHRAVLGPMGLCETSMEKFTCAGAAHTAGLGEVLDVSLETTLSLMLGMAGGGGLHRGAGLFDDAINVGGYRAGLQADIQHAIRQRVLANIAESASARAASRFGLPRVWGPHNGPGPLGADVAATFRSSTYRELVLSEDVVLYRVYGGTAGDLSPYWSRVQPRRKLPQRSGRNRPQPL